MSAPGWQVERDDRLMLWHVTDENGRAVAVNVPNEATARLIAEAPRLRDVLTQTLPVLRTTPDASELHERAVAVLARTWAVQRKAGAARSPRKAKAARRNGRLGGRPRKVSA